MMTLLQKFFAPVDGSFKGFLNLDELFRSIITSLGSASTVGVVLMVLQAILTNVGLIFPNPAVAALATALISLLIDLLRRINQGATPTPSPAPSAN